MTNTSCLPITFTLSVIASGAKQSSALVGESGLPRRFTPRNDGTGVGV
jgi:hypothetical protein